MVENLRHATKGGNKKAAAPHENGGNGLPVCQKYFYFAPI
jgi:hypothetical protein